MAAAGRRALAHLARLARERTPLCAFVAGSLGYALGAAGGATWMDSGELAAAADQLGVAHPPGHPAYVMLGKLAALFPLGEIGHRLALLSALAMGAALAATVATARQLIPRIGAAAALATLLAALAPTVVWNAHRVEVYGPVLALTGWGTWGVLAFLRDGRPRHLLVAALALAAAASIHPLIAAAVAAPLAVAAALAARRRLAILLPLSLGLGALALTSYALLWIRANAASPPALAWGDPSSWGAAWDVMTGVGYRQNFALGELGGRVAAALSALAEGTGRPLLLAGIAGLLLGLATRLRGCGVLLGVMALSILGAATQSRLNPDLRAYLIPALFSAAVGLAVLADAVARLAGATEGRFRLAVHGAAVLGVGLFGFCGEASPEQPELGAAADLAACFDDTAGAMPPGPALYFANSDATLFASMYEQLVAGARPDVAVANAELVRDVWFLSYVKARVPELYAPYLDDGVAGKIAERLAVSNLRRGRPVGADVPAFGALLPSHAEALGRGYRLLLEPGGQGAEEAPPPPRYRGAVGRRMARRIALIRAAYEEARDRLGGAARALGLSASWTRALAVVPSQERPALFGHLPHLTPVFLWAPWLERALVTDLLWRGGGPPAPPRGPPEQRILAAWQRLLSGDWDAGESILAELDEAADEATTRLLMDLDRGPLAERHLRAVLERRGEKPGALALLASVLGNRGSPEALAEAESLFARAAELDPKNDETFARLGVVRARRGEMQRAVEAWRRALAIAPKRADVRSWLEKAGASP